MPVRVELARLTATQYQQSVADLVGSFRGLSELGNERGLRGEYYDDRNTRRDKRKIDRLDPQIQFDFGVKSPDPDQIKEEAFAIEWEGGLIVEESGDYEFCVRTENGFKLYINADSDKALIDGWVSSGALADQRVTLTLLGGHVYPLRLKYFKYKEKSASIKLLWKPPHGVETVIPQESLTPLKGPPLMVVSTAFPADDRSMGYVRGTAVSKAWHEATTSAAVEVADHVVNNLEDLAGAKKESDKWLKAVRSLCRQFVERAFRRPLSDEESAFFVGSRFSEGLDEEAAVKRVILLALKSPRFLFPEVQAPSDSKNVASRLALTLRDTLPNKPFWSAANEGKLDSRDGVRTVAKELLDHRQTRTKLRGFFDHWLHIDEEHDLAKDPKLFPDFDRET
ncbi:MAG: PA14 domain-containing protein, partial [Verrucomicrobiales bacterium]